MAECGVVVRILRHLALAWEAPVTEPSRAPPALEFEFRSEVVGKTAAPGGAPHGTGPCFGVLEGSGGCAEGDFGRALAVAAGGGGVVEEGRRSHRGPE